MIEAKKKQIRELKKQIKKSEGNERLQYQKMYLKAQDELAELEQHQQTARPTLSAERLIEIYSDTVTVAVQTFAKLIPGLCAWSVLRENIERHVYQQLLSGAITEFNFTGEDANLIRSTLLSSPTPTFPPDLSLTIEELEKYIAINRINQEQGLPESFINPPVR